MPVYEYQGQHYDLPDTDPALAKQKILAYLAKQQPPSKERTYGEALQDIGAGVVGGIGSLVQLPGQLYGLATGDMRRTGALGVGKDIEEYAETLKSAGLKAREEARRKAIEEATAKEGQFGAFKSAFSETVKDPALLLTFLAEQAPQLLVPFGAAKIAKGATAARGAGEVAAAQAGVRGAIGAAGVQQGADVGAGAYENIYAELKSKGASDKEAAEGALNLARAAGASGAIISLLAQRLPGARALEESFAGVPGVGGRAARASRGALGESASEVTEEVGGRFGQNLAMREVKPEQSLTEGLGETAGMSAIGGGLLGGVAGLARRPAPPEAPTIEQPPPPPPTPEQQRIEQVTGVQRQPAVGIEGLLSAQEAARQEAERAPLQPGQARATLPEFERGVTSLLRPGETRAEPLPEFQTSKYGLRPGEARVEGEMPSFEAPATAEVRQVQEDVAAREKIARDAEAKRVREVQTVPGEARSATDEMLEIIRRIQLADLPNTPEPLSTEERNYLRNRLIELQQQAKPQPRVGPESRPEAKTEGTLGQLPTATAPEVLAQRQAEVEKRRAEAGFPTAEQRREGIRVVEKPKAPKSPVPRLADPRPMTQEQANARLGVMRSILTNQGGDPNSLGIVPHPSASGKFAIKSFDLPFKLSAETQATAFGTPEKPVVIDPVEAYVNIARQTNTPAAKRFVKDWEAGRIPREDVERALQTERQLLSLPPLTFLGSPEAKIAQQQIPGPTIQQVQMPKPRGERELPPPLQPRAEPPPAPVEPPPAATGPVKTFDEFKQAFPVDYKSAEVERLHYAKDFGGMIDYFKNHANPIYRRVAELSEPLRKKVKLLRPQNIGAKGMYVPSKDQIVMGTRYAGSEKTTIHEMVHALVARQQLVPGPQSRKFVQDIKKLREYAYKELKKRGKLKDPNTGGEWYAFNTDTDTQRVGIEFVTEALAYPEFQYELMQIPYSQSQSVWSKFVELVADLLGIQNKTALSEILSLVESLSQTPRPSFGRMPDVVLPSQPDALALKDASARDIGSTFKPRTKPDPKQTVKAYKLFRVDPRKPGQLFPLFVSANDPVGIGTWLDAGTGKSTAEGKVKSKLGPLAFRPGWHAGDLPIATHIGGKSKSDLTAPDIRPENQVWAEVELAADRDWQSEANKRGTNAQGKLISVRAHITDQLPEDGYYRYKTNPNMTGNWLISGSMKVNRILSDEEVRSINAEAGAADLPRQKPFDAAKYGFENKTSQQQLIEDIPNEDWLQGKIDYAIQKGRNSYGVPHRGTITGYFDKPVEVPVGVLSKLKGQSNEQDNVRESSLKYIRENWDEVSKKPPYIEVAYNGEASVSEGNHRIMVAAEKGLKSLPVRIRYFDGGQRRDGPLSPARITSLNELGPADLILEDKLTDTAEKVKEKAKEVLQKRGPLKLAPQVSAEAAEKFQQTFAPENKTIIDKIEGLKDRFWQRMSQGIADQFRSIKEYDEKAYMQARLSKSVDGGLEGLLFYGEVYNDDGALNIRKDGKGLIKALEPVGTEVDNFMIWVALNREEQLQQEGKIPSIPSELIAEKNNLSSGTLNGQPRLQVYKRVLEDMNKLNRSVLKIALDTGLIDQKGYDKFASDIYYVPFYKEMEGKDIDAPSTASGLTSQYFSKQLKGGEKPFGDLVENTLRNWNHILSAAMKNQAAVSTIQSASSFRLGDTPVVEPTTEKTGSAKIMVDGQAQYFKINDPLLFEAISAIGYLGPKSKFLDVARDFKNILQYGVTLSPAFKVNNLIRDSVSAMAVSGLNKNPITNVLTGVSIFDKNDPTYISALAGGAIFNFGTAYEGDQSKLLKRLIEKGIDRDTILDTPDRIKKGLRMAWEKYQDWGNASEAANRLALYKQLRDKGLSHLEATYQARDLLDFSMQGSWPAFRLVTQVVPFMNARIQGLYKLGRDGVIPTSRALYNVATGKEIEGTDKQKAEAFSVVTGAVMLASMALYLSFKDDEEYQKRDEWDRDNFWWFKLPGMDVALRVPKPFEIGAFGTLTERILEQVIDEGAEGKQMTDAIKRLLGDTFALNPTPQMFKPLLDLYANKDSFTGAPIESAGLERLSKQERVNDNTSALAIALGGISTIFPEKFELSPVQVDYAIKGYFGWLGGLASTTSTYAVMPFKEGAYPDTKWIDRASLGLARDLPSNQARYVTAFYENGKEINQAYADMRHYAETGDAEKVEKILEEKGDQIALAKFYEKTADNMANVRKQIRVIMADTTMDGAAKREEIDRMKMIIAELAKQAEEARKSFK
jgi:hypothetical protein